MGLESASKIPRLGDTPGVAFEQAAAHLFDSQPDHGPRGAASGSGKLPNEPDLTQELFRQQKEMLAAQAAQQQAQMAQQQAFLEALLTKISSNSTPTSAATPMTTRGPAIADVQVAMEADPYVC